MELFVGLMRWKKLKLFDGAAAGFGFFLGFWRRSFPSNGCLRFLSLRFDIFISIFFQQK